MERDEVDGSVLGDDFEASLPGGWGRPACVIHADAAPEWECRACGGRLCNACVTHRRVQNLDLYFCSQCGGDCVSAEAAAAEADLASEQTFGGGLIDAFAYPLRGGGWAVLLGAALLLWTVGLLSSFASGIVAGVAMGVLVLLLVFFGTGYIAAYLFRVIQSSAQGEDRLPDWPDFGDVWNDLLLPLCRLAGTVLVYIAPAVLLHKFFGGDERGWLFWTAYATGLFCLPMALVAVAQFESIGAVNPLLVIPSIIKTFGHYLVAVLLLSVVVGIGEIGPAVLVTYVPWVGGLLGWVVSFYFLFVQMRVLGLIYHHHEARLNWFPALVRRRGIGDR